MDVFCIMDARFFYMRFEFWFYMSFRTGSDYSFDWFDPSKIKEQARQKVKEITEALEDLIDNFESDLTKHLKAKPSAWIDKFKIAHD